MNKKIKNRHVQSSVGWCTVYAMSNIFNTDKLLHLLEDEKFKGCGKPEVDYMLKILNPELKAVDVLNAHPSYPSLPVSYVYDVLLTPEDCVPPLENPLVPYLLTVKLIPGIYHQVFVLNISGQLWYSDPYQEEMVHVRSAEELSSKFIECCNAERFYKPEIDRFAIFDKDQMNYIFINEKEDSLC